MSGITYTIKSLQELADHFQSVADALRASGNKQALLSQRCALKSEAIGWESAADILRNTVIESPSFSHSQIPVGDAVESTLGEFAKANGGAV